ncbi:MAG: hypothetical protein LBQ05_02005, partial [Christensenellaceae bacterium]|nr:hypothetical protein [Christensenellaceae bacterium]
MNAFNVSGSVGKIIKIANDAAKTGEVMPIHLLYGCCLVKDSLACQYLAGENITAEKLTATKNIFFPNQTVNTILKMAEEESKIFGQPAIVSEALLFVLVAKCSQTRNILESINPGSSKRLAGKILIGEGLNPEKLNINSGDENKKPYINFNTVQWGTTDPKTAYKNPKFPFFTDGETGDESGGGNGGETDGGNGGGAYGNGGGNGGGAIENVVGNLFGIRGMTGENYNGNPQGVRGMTGENYNGNQQGIKELSREILLYGQDLTAKARRGKIDNI